MVASLLSVDGTPVDDPMKGFSEDWIEGLIHLDVGVGAAKSEGNHILESLDRIRCLGCSF